MESSTSLTQNRPAGYKRLELSHSSDSTTQRALHQPTQQDNKIRSSHSSQCMKRRCDSLRRQQKRKASIETFTNCDAIKS